MLVQGEVALPYDPLLEEELVICQAWTNSSGRLQIISKKECQEIILRSPDRFDAVILAVAGSSDIDFGACDVEGKVPW